MAAKKLGWWLAIVCACTSLPSHATNMTHRTTFVDPLGLASSWYAQIDAHVGAALQGWGSVLNGAGSFAVEVEITTQIPRATGRSTTSAFLFNDGQFNVFEQGMAFQFRTGIDPNGAVPDIQLQFNPFYLANELWFDPDPVARQAVVPSDRTDAMSVMLHEIGHALAFNGWGDHFTGELPADYASTWDILVTNINGELFFTGAHAVNLHGAPVPVTLGNNFHLGNPFGPGLALVPDLMNGVVFFRGARYDISPLNVAMLADMGVPVLTVPIPEPGTLPLLGLGATAVFLVSRARRRRNAGELSAH